MVIALQCYVDCEKKMAANRYFRAIRVNVAVNPQVSKKKLKNYQTINFDKGKKVEPIY